MVDVGSIWSNFWGNLGAVTNTIRFTDVLDVVIVAYLIYHGIRLVRETRAMQLVKGIVIVLVLYFVAEQFNMITLTFIITTILQWGIVALAVLFQPELRRALEQVGRSKIAKIGRFGGEVDEDTLLHNIDIICEAATYLSDKQIGALMVIERDTKLGEIINTGTIIDATPSMEMIVNVFFPNSPLHDGAMIIRGGRLHAAGCFLPLSSNMEIGRELGTRHRAALGMSEVSDALIIVVSEETGSISVALDSRLQRRLSAQNLGKLLKAKLMDKGSEVQEEKKKNRFAFWRWGRK